MHISQKKKDMEPNPSVVFRLLKKIESNWAEIHHNGSL